MASFRFPVLLWEDAGGWWTAAVVESYFDVWSGAATSREALQLIREALQERFRRRPWEPPPDLHDVRLRSHKVPVRTEYEIRDRFYPASQPVEVKVWAVTGEESTGALICYLPMLDVDFGFYDEAEVPDLVRTQVQELFRGKSPQDLMEYLPPRRAQLDDVVIQVKARPPLRSELEPALENLRAVAEPLGDPRLRRQFTRAWERDSEIAEIVRRLSRERANLLLVGPAGIGKSAILVDAVRRLERRENGEAGEGGHRYWQTSGPRLIAGMRYLGQWEERFAACVRELAVVNGVLCLERLADVVQLGGEEATDSIAAFMSTFMQHGELRLVAEATPAELDRCRRQLPGFVEQFQVMRVGEFSDQHAMAVLERLAQQTRQQWRLRWEREATSLIYRLHRRFAPYQSFPGRVTAFLQRLVEQVRRQGRSTVSRRRVFEQFARETGLPGWMLRDEEALELADVEAALAERVIGQPAACRAVAHAVTTFKAALNDPNRPIGVLLFLGPTGVGKTQLARTLADYLFGHGAESDRLVRLDMSEYGGHDAADRLVMTPDGRPSQFLQRVRRQPFSVVLFDEIEKASPEVFDVLLNLLDEGRLTDRQGRITWFRSALIIMTSNIGSTQRPVTGFGGEAPPLGEADLMRTFRPEFVNRIDELVSFRPLQPADIAAIARLELAELAQREGLQRRQLTLRWDEAVVQAIATRGWDAALGARPLQRTVEREVAHPLARYLLNHMTLRDTVISLAMADGQVVVAGSH